MIEKNNLKGWLYLLPAFLFGLLVNVVVSLCTPAPDKEVLEQYVSGFN